MSILIKGMEMPQEKKITITIFPDGRVYENHGERLWGHGKDCIPWKAVPVPPHGRLIDKDALEADISASVVFSGRDGNAEIIGAKKIINRLHVAPTVLEAEEGE